MNKVIVAFFLFASLSSDIRTIDLSIRLEQPMPERQLWLLEVNGGKRWVCNDPNCPEHCAEILNNLRKNP